MLELTRLFKSIDFIFVEECITLFILCLYLSLVFKCFQVFACLAMSAAGPRGSEGERERGRREAGRGEGEREEGNEPFDCKSIKICSEPAQANFLSFSIGISSQIHRHLSEPISFHFQLEFNCKSTKICSEPSQNNFLSFSIRISLLIKENLL